MNLPTPLVRPPANLHEVVQRELATPGRYRLSFTPSAPRHAWWEPLWRWIGDRLDAFFSALEKHVHFGTGGQTAVGDLLILLFVLIVAFLAARLLAAVQLEGERHAASAPLAAQRNAHALMVQAGRLAEEHEYAHAIRVLFAASVTLLDLRGVVHDDVSATVNELRLRVRERAAQAEDPFMELARAYTSAAYAERPADLGLWSRARDAYEHLVRGAK